MCAMNDHPPVDTSPARSSVKSGFRPRLLALAVAVSCLALAAPARPAIVTWTGNTPVYLASWYNGYYTEEHEFQYLLDWQGFCNAHFGSTCTAPTYWGSAGNWDTGVPGGTDIAHTPAGSTVLISGYVSLYQGPIQGGAYAASLSADGRVIVASNGALSTGGAAIADLELGGELNSNGLTSVGYLSVASGKLSGTGTTTVGTMGSAFFQPVIGSGHTLSIQNYDPVIYLGSPYYSSFTPRPEAKAHLINNGNLELGYGQVMPQGSFTTATLPRFTNSGNLRLHEFFTVSDVVFDNAGSIHVKGSNPITGRWGMLTAGSGGTHSGSFTGDAGSEMVFIGYGGKGHVFQSGSSLNSDGRVVFEKSVHKVSGSYRAVETEFRNAAEVTFDGSLSFLDRVLVTSGNAYLKTSAGANIGELVLNGGLGVIYFNTGSPSNIGTVTLNSGAIAGFQTVNISGPFNWNGGGASGSIYANGGIEMDAGVRTFGGFLRNNGTVNWNAGSFSSWNGVFDNPTGHLVDMKGDFRAGYALSTIPGGGAFAGRFDNAGVFRKSAGGGIANLDMVFNNLGQVEALAGELLLRGGGSHTGSFVAATGARIELMGNTVITGPVTTSGRVDIKGHYWRDHTLTLAGGGNYTNAAGNSIGIINVAIQPGASLVNVGTMSLQGASTPRSFSNAGSFLNKGSFAVDGPFGNSGSIGNTGYVTLAGTGSNSGAIDNTGQWTNKGSFTAAAGSTFTNSGTLVNDGGLFHVASGGSVSGPGSYSQWGGTTSVEGTLEAGGGINISAGLLKGTGSIVGNINLGGGATVQPGNSPGTLTIDGNLFAYNTTFEIELAGPSLYDQLVVNGSAEFNQGLVKFILTDGYQPAVGDSFSWLVADGETTGLDTPGWDILVEYRNGDQTSYETWSPPEGMQVSFGSNGLAFTAAPVPEAQTWLMLLAGLGLVGLQRRRVAV